MYNEKTFLGVGWKFPIEVDEVTGRIKTSSYEEDIKEAIYIILKTKIGERVMNPKFGCKVSDYIFELTDYTVLSTLQGDIRKALTVWEPRIIDINVSVTKNKEEGGRIDICIDYVVRSTNNPFNLVYPYYLNESY